jgi:hypothetical protein
VSGQAGTWLDRPLQNWNRPAAALPRGSARADDAATARCKLSTPETAAARVLADAGWIPQPHLDRELVLNDVEILAGVAGLDGSCAPTAFNLFVFVGGAFAGTLSPGVMALRADAAAGPVRFVGEHITAEFARYKEGDAGCCPTARMSVRYRIDRASGGPVVAPVDVRRTRSY